MFQLQISGHTQRATNQLNALPEECRVQSQWTGTASSQWKEQRRHKRRTPMQEKQQPQPPTHKQKNAKTNNHSKNAVGQTNSRPEEDGKEAATRASSFQIISYQLGKTQNETKMLQCGRKWPPKSKKKKNRSKKVASFYQDSWENSLHKVSCRDKV